MKQCDVIIKKMVFNQGDTYNPAHTYDLVRALFDVLREVMKRRGE